jgi:hypothetical protein
MAAVDLKNCRREVCEKNLARLNRYLAAYDPLRSVRSASIRVD